ADLMHRLEDVLLAVLADLGLEGRRRPGIIGVWVGNDKVAALGARIERGVSYHGFALNVSTNLEHFRLIVPCGISDGGVTSVERALGRPVDWQAALAAVRHRFAEAFRLDLLDLAAADLEERLRAAGAGRR
ncbi:MAG: lipoyl(octanoyl) transferase, partial [Anaerolineae bacterium]|nr:lipoyl(octanoyl) transferase [Anaerolineae bacterium]